MAHSPRPARGAVHLESWCALPSLSSLGSQEDWGGKKNKRWGLPFEGGEEASPACGSCCVTTPCPGAEEASLAPSGATQDVSPVVFSLLPSQFCTSAASPCIREERPSLTSWGRHVVEVLHSCCPGRRHCTALGHLEEGKPELPNILSPQQPTGAAQRESYWAGERFLGSRTILCGWPMALEGSTCKHCLASHSRQAAATPAPLLRDQDHTAPLNKM